MTHLHTLRHEMRLLTALTLAGCGALATTTAQAQRQLPPYAYGGVSVGQARAQHDADRIAAGQLGPGISRSSVTEDATDTAYRLFGGVQFSRFLGMEAGVFDLGRYRLDAATLPAGSLAGQTRTRGLHLDLVGTLPVTEQLSVLGRVGAHHARTRSTFVGTGGVTPLEPNQSVRSTNPKVGVGLQYALGSSVLLRGEVERYRVNDASGGHGGVNVVSMSLVVPFGGAVEPLRTAMPAPPAPAPRMAPPPEPAPAVTAPPPEPPPVVVAAPVAPPEPPPRSRVSFSAESLFSFDRSTVQPEGRAALDKFASDLSGTQFDTISVEGHTDRLGKPAYNQKLSLERANAVKDHLVTSGRIDPARITATGKGESTPVTGPGDCKGVRQTPALVTCLQPDRRVEIEVTGMR